jgi:hypothetical protein
MPPLDFAADPAELDATAITVLAPVTRQRLQKFIAALTAPSIPARPSPVQGIRQAPLATLQTLALRRQRLVDPVPAPATAAVDASVKAWQAAWAECVAAIAPVGNQPPLLWYIRRRALPGQAAIAGIAVPVGTDDVTLKAQVDARLGALGLTAQVAAVIARATPFAVARLTAFLGAPRINASDVLLPAAVTALEAALPPAVAPGPITTPPILTPPASAGLSRLNSARDAFRLVTRPPLPPGTPLPLTEADVVDVASDFEDPHLGDGLALLASAMMADPLVRGDLVWLGGSGQALAVDGEAAALGSAALADFAGKLRPIVRGKETDALVQLLAQAG